MMIDNFITYLFNHEGKWTKTLFSAESLEANIGNTWDENRGCAKGAYHDEFIYAAEDEPTISATIKYMSISGSKTTTSNISTTKLLQHSIPSTLQKILFGNGNEYSVSTLGTRVTQYSKRQTPTIPFLFQYPDLPTSTNSSVTSLLSLLYLITTKMNEIEKDYN